jgi:hypothetical protein
MSKVYQRTAPIRKFSKPEVTRNVEKLAPFAGSNCQAKRERSIKTSESKGHKVKNDASPSEPTLSLLNSLLLVTIAFAVSPASKDQQLARPQMGASKHTFARRQAPISLQIKRAQEHNRGRHATSPFDIPWRGWKDILLRTASQASEDRLLAIAAGVVFYGLLALFPAIAALVSCYACSPSRARSTIT